MTGRASGRKPDVCAANTSGLRPDARHIEGKAMALLRDTATGRDYPLRGPSVTVGRSAECDIQLNSPQVSGRHALIICANDIYYLTDMGSSNGTQINGKRVKGSTRSPWRYHRPVRAVIYLVHEAQGKHARPRSQAALPGPLSQPNVLQSLKSPRSAAGRIARGEVAGHPEPAGTWAPRRSERSLPQNP